MVSSSRSECAMCCRVWATLWVLVLAGSGFWSVQNQLRFEETKPAVESQLSTAHSTERCALCHEDIVQQYQSAPHSRTLTRATDEDVLKHFAGRKFQRQATGVEYEFVVRDDQLFVSSPAYGRDLLIEWIFGSGTHAQTPLVTWTNEYGGTASLEHMVSWYPDDTLDVTLGLEKLRDPHGILAMGNPHPPDETINCFGCHSTHVETDDLRIDFNHTLANVGCQRCHWQADQHAIEVDNGLEGRIEVLSQLSPEESVDRCGECHRRAEEMGGEIEPDNTTLIRFASVGLVQSPCFKQQDTVKLATGESARLDCITCHDPHQATNPDWRFHAGKCLQCHNASAENSHICSVASSEDNCLPCHMPSVPSNDKLNFTDHWIRIRKE